MIMHYTEQLHCIANYKSKVTRSRVVTSRPTFTRSCKSFFKNMINSSSAGVGFRMAKGKSVGPMHK